MKSKLLFVALLFAGLENIISAEPLKTDQLPVELWGDFVEYRQKENIISGRGNIRIKQGDTELMCQEFAYHLDKKIIFIQGEMLWKQGPAEIRGRDGEYDSILRRGKIFSAKVKAPPWYITAGKLEQLGPKEFLMFDADVTSCDLPKPHYFVHTPRAKMVLDKKVVSFNNLVYFDNFPTFYWPFFYRSLAPRHYSLEIQPGQGAREGFFLKNIFGYPLTEHTYGKLYLDYFSRLGWGKGLEYNYNLAERVKGSFFVYQIKENEKATDTGVVTKTSNRWTARFYHNQSFNKNLVGILNMNYFSDDTFNKLYNQGDWNWRTQELRSSGSLSSSRPLTISRLTVDRIDVWDTTSNKFVVQSLSAPQFSFVTQPIKKTFLPFFYSLSFRAANNFQRSEDFYRQSMQGNLNLTNSFRLTRRVTLTPAFGFSEDWSNQKTRLDRTDTYESRYFTQLNWRTRVAPWLDVDLAHNFRQKLETKSELEDDPDRGIEENRLALATNSIWLNAGNFRFRTGYDFRRAKGESIEDWRKKLEPLSEVFQFSPTKRVNLYFSHSYNIFLHRVAFMESEISLGEKTKNYFFWGNSYQGSQAGQLGTRLGVNFWLTRGWQIQFSNRYDVFYAGKRIDNFNEIEREIKVYRDLHCWEINAYVRQRAAAGVVPLAREFWVNINLKINNQSRARLYSVQQEQQWYPWR